ncbi:hypothetical protein LA080_008765 [Diaporthe eres]|nr:hypothetical protein LA080_008765 [Diaporthe eres]
MGSTINPNRGRDKHVTRRVERATRQRPRAHPGRRHHGWKSSFQARLLPPLLPLAALLEAELPVYDRCCRCRRHHDWKPNFQFTTAAAAAAADTTEESRTSSSRLLPLLLPPPPGLRSRTSSSRLPLPLLPLAPPARNRTSGSRPLPPSLECTQSLP